MEYNLNWERVNDKCESYTNTFQRRRPFSFRLFVINIYRNYILLAIIFNSFLFDFENEWIKNVCCHFAPFI